MEQQDADAIGSGPLIVVEVIDGADETQVVIGRRYWDLHGFDEDGKPIWACSTKHIDTDFAGPVYVVAARAVRARAEGSACASCGGDLTLTSRAAFERACKAQPVKCVGCDASMQDHLKRVPDPAKAARRKAKSDREARAAAKRDRIKALSRAQQGAVHERFPVELTGNTPLPEASVPAEAFALALLQYAPTGTGPIGPVAGWPAPLHPGPEQDRELFAELYEADLIGIHPSSDITAFGWEDADLADPDCVPPPSTYGPREVLWYVPHGATIDQARSGAVEVLLHRAKTALNTVEGVEELLALGRELVAGETLRYFRLQLDELRLPPLPHHHTERLHRVAHHAAEALSLGQLYNLAWKAAHGAASTAHARPYVPKPNMTVNALNRLERDITEALETDVTAIKHYRRLDRLPLCPLTLTVFKDLLHRDPVATSLADVRQQYRATTSTGGDAAAEGAWPLLSCTRCRLPVEAASAWLWVDVRAALDRLAVTSEGGTEPGKFGLAPPLVVWQITHDQCASSEGALHDLLVPGTDQGMLRFAAEILQKSNWILQTDLAALLDECAARTGRFALAVDPWEGGIGSDAVHAPF